MMLLKFSRGFKDIITKTARFKEFPGIENTFLNSRGFKEIKVTWEPWIVNVQERMCREIKTFGNCDKASYSHR